MYIATASRAEVGVARAKAAVYPSERPFHPDTAYPEYPFPDCLSREKNHVYQAVRELFLGLGYDAERAGTPAWNPLGHLVNPGMRVVIKPNLVLSFHKSGKDLFSVITHPSILRAVADYCWIALQGRGALIIADAPQYNCNFEKLLEITGLGALSLFYKARSGPTFDILDLRHYWSAGRHFPSMRRPLPGDAGGNILVNLGPLSAFHGRPSKGYYGAVYHRQETIKHHSGDRQEYELGGTMLQADLLISVPKMKVHKKVGVTLNVKGLVGMATSKNLLVHYTLGTPSTGGDQFPDNFLKPRERFLIGLERLFYDTFLARRSVPLEYIHRSLYALHGLTTRKLGLTVGRHKGFPKRIFDAGNWYGNDTCWRMSADLAKVVYFADREGMLRPRQQRPFLSVIDGIIGGEGQGPLEPDPKPSGVLLGGENLIAVDLVAARLMGFDPFALKMYEHLLASETFDFGARGPGDILVRCEDAAIRACLTDREKRFFAYEPHPGWKGYIEVNPQPEERII